MSTVEDFKNAPVGATATRADGSRAMKVHDIEPGWIVQGGGVYFSGEGMVFWGYALDPTVPTAAREALDLAWELAHPVKPGQVIPEGARFMEFYDTGVREYTALWDIEIGFHTAPEIRTVEPLHEQEPDWLDAPAVVAVCGYCETKTLHGPLEGRSRWECAECQTATSWRALTDVTPLYPKETEA